MLFVCCATGRLTSFSFVIGSGSSPRPTSAEVVNDKINVEKLSTVANASSSAGVDEGHRIIFTDGRRIGKISFRSVDQAKIL